MRNCTSYVAKTKALISFAVTSKLICVFVFVYAKSRFSHDEAQILKIKIHRERTINRVNSSFPDGGHSASLTKLNSISAKVTKSPKLESMKRRR